MSFNFKASLAAFRQELIAQGHFETGLVEELVANLNDRYDEFLIKGEQPETAFQLARQRVLPAKIDSTASLKKLNKAINRPTGLIGSFFFLLPNFFKIARRQLYRKQLYNAFNFCCLTIGIFTTILAVLYLEYETSYDRFVPNIEQKFRLGRTQRSQDYSIVSFDGFFSATAEQQLHQIEGLQAVSGIVSACQFFIFSEPTYVQINDKRLPATNLLQTNTPKAFFDFFGWKFLTGSLNAFYQSSNTAVLTRRQAERFFGSDWAQKISENQQLILEEEPYQIAGVIEDVAANTHFDFSIALNRPKIDYWGARIYLELLPRTKPEQVLARIDQSMPSINARIAANELYGGSILQPISSIHLDSDILYELKPPGDKRYLYIIGIIAAIILLMTVSNYMNLSIAMNAGRSREIGMRKIFGASPRLISSQFILESVLISWLTIPVVFTALWFVLPRFNQLMGTAIDEQLFSSAIYVFLVVGIASLIGLIASIYPALFLANFSVLALFRNNLTNNTNQFFSTRKLLITFQFMLLIGLCSLTLLINQQLHYIQTKELGFNTEQILYTYLPGDSSSYQLFRDAALQLPAVQAVGSGSTLAGQPYNQTTYKLAGTTEIFDDAYNISMDYQSLALLNIQTSIPELVARPENAPGLLVLINETLVEKLTTYFSISREELIGKTIIEEPEYVDEDSGEVGFPFTITGTFADINMFSLHHQISPTFLSVYRSLPYAYSATIAYQGSQTAEVIAQVKEQYETLFPDRIFEYNFLEENIETLYENEQRIAHLGIYFSFVAFLVAVIGLIALTAYLTTIRRKEIGIRKILGASQWDILRRFNAEYFLLLAIALLLSSPLVWWGINRWLLSFAYRIDISMGVFLMAGFITLVITGLVVSLTALRASNQLPVQALQENQ
ncbi:MAG: FtsX-like permease family protein [Bacteroidota bacterium]